MHSPDLDVEQWVSAWLGVGLGVRQPPPMPDGADFNRQVVEFCHRHWVGGLLARQLEANETYQCSDLLHWLKLAQNLALAPSAGWEEGVGQVLHALRGMPVIVLKGWALIYTQYKGDASLRQTTDLDVLLSPGSFLAARQRLLALGYAPFSPQPWESFYQTVRLGENLYKPGTVPVGLHQSTLPLPGKREAAMIEDWFSHAQAVEIAGEPAFSLCAEDNLIYLCAHLALHHQYHPALFRYYDMVALLIKVGAAFDWAAVLRRAQDWQLVLPLQRCLTRLDELWRGVIPAERLAQVLALPATGAERRLHHWSAEKAHTAFTSLGEMLVSQISARAQTRLVLGTLCPSPAYMRWRYGRKPRGLGWLAYLQRAGMGVKAIFK